MSIKPTIYSIQSLRGIAALMVVMAHSQVYLHARSYIDTINPFLDLGRAGVDLFFIISGFIMVFVAGNKFGEKSASIDFLLKRIIRVVPLYWFYTLIITILLISMPQYFSQGKSFDILHFMASIFFVPWENTIGLHKPVLMVGWTLNYEMYFYLIFAFLLQFSKNKFIPLIALYMLSSVLSGFLFEVEIPLLKMMASPLLLEFLMGCIIGNLFVNNIRVNKEFCLAFILVGIAGFVFVTAENMEGVNRLIKWGLPAAFMISGLVFMEVNGFSMLRNKYLVKLGDSSYSLYLSHIFTINLLGKFWFMIVDGYYLMFIFVAMILSAIIGYIAYLIIEMPMIHYLTDKYKKYSQYYFFSRSV